MPAPSSVGFCRLPLSFSGLCCQPLLKFLLAPLGGVGFCGQTIALGSAGVSDRISLRLASKRKASGVYWVRLSEGVVIPSPTPTDDAVWSILYALAIACPAHVFTHKHVAPR